MKNDNGKKRKSKVIISMVVLIIVGIIFITAIASYLYIKEKNIAEKEELNRKLEECYVAINENYDYEKYKEIVSTIKDDIDKEKAYEKLNEALSNQVEKQKNEYNNDRKYKLFNLFETIKKTENNEKIIQIAEYNHHINLYNDYIRLGKLNEEEDDFFSAYNCYNSACRESNSIKDEEKKNEVSAKRTEMKDKAIKELKEEFNKKIKEKDYSGYYHSEEEFIKNCEDNELKEIYTKYTEDKKNKEWEEEKAKRKSQGVYLGMTKQQVLDSSWGEPKDINTSIGSWGVHEQWVYGNGNYLYFENGKLTSIQN